MRNRIAIVGVALLFCAAAMVAAQSSQDLSQQARSKEDVGDFEGAIKIYNRIVQDFTAAKDRPQVAVAKVRLGYSWTQLGDAKGLDFLNDVIRNYPDQPEARAAAQSLIALLTRPPASDRSPLEIKTPFTNDAYSFAISPDGRSLVFLVTVADGNSQLWVRQIDSGKDRPIPGTESNRYGDSGSGANPFWAPDGRSIGYFEDKKLKRIDVDGGNARSLADAPENYGGSWGSSGTIVFVPSNLSPVLRVPAQGGKPAPATRLGPEQTSHRYPRFLPDGRHFLLGAMTAPDALADSGVMSVGSLDSLETRNLGLSAVAPSFASPDRLVFVQSGLLLTQRLDLQTLKMTGSSTRLADRIANRGTVGAVIPLLGALSVFTDGSLAYRAYAEPRRQLEYRDRAGRPAGNLGKSEGSADTLLSDSSPRFSPDGQTVTVYWNGQALLFDVASGEARELRFGSGANARNSPVWEPGGRSLAFADKAPSNGAFDLYQRPSAGADGMGEMLYQSDESKTPEDFSPDGRFLLFTRTNASTGADILALVLRFNVPVPVAVTAAQEQHGRFAPNSQWIAYESDEVGGRFEIFVQRFPASQGGRRQQVSSNGGRLPQWSRDGRELYFLADNRLMVAAVTFSADGRGIELGQPANLMPSALPAGSSYAPAPDGQRFLINAPIETAPPIMILSKWGLASALTEGKR